MIGTAYSIPAGDAGTAATVRTMARLARSGAVTPLVRGVAARLVMGAGANPLVQAKIVRDWVDSHTQYLADPSTAELLYDPAASLHLILTEGIGQLDCDDVATLAAALGLSIGLRAKFVVVAFGSPNNPYQHVWAELAPPSGVWWLPIDPTRPVQGLASASVSRGFEMEV
jgi:transglutaminase-like putative cysteine protease